MIVQLEKPKKTPPKLLGFAKSIYRHGYFQGKPKKWVRQLYKYECVCGNIFISEKRKVDNGETSSCGCFRKKMSEYNMRNLNISLTEAKKIRDYEKSSKIKLENIRRKLSKTGLRNSTKKG